MSWEDDIQNGTAQPNVAKNTAKAINRLLRGAVFEVTREGYECADEWSDA